MAYCLEDSGGNFVAALTLAGSRGTDLGAWSAGGTCANSRREALAVRTVPVAGKHLVVWEDFSFEWVVWSGDKENQDKNKVLEAKNETDAAWDRSQPKGNLFSEFKSIKIDMAGEADESDSLENLGKIANVHCQHLTGARETKRSYVIRDKSGAFLIVIPANEDIENSSSVIDGKKTLLEILAMKHQTKELIRESNGLSID